MLAFIESVYVRNQINPLIRGVSLASNQTLPVSGVIRERLNHTRLDQNWKRRMEIYEDSDLGDFTRFCKQKEKLKI